MLRIADRMPKLLQLALCGVMLFANGRDSFAHEKKNVDRDKDKGILIETAIPLKAEDAHALDQECKNRSLKLDRHFSDFLVYHYAWKQDASAKRVASACKKLKKFPFVKACEGDAGGASHAAIADHADPFHLGETGPDRLKAPQQCTFGPQIQTNLNPARARGLSNYWAQEYIGADFAREIVSDDRSTRSSPELVFALDGEDVKEHAQDIHLIHVISLLQGPEAASVLPMGSGSVKSDNGGSSDLNQLEILHSLSHHRIISNPMNWANSPILGDAFLDIATEGAIVVTSAENDDIKENNGSRGGIIVVSGLKPYGTFGDLDEVASSTTVSAPSDETILSGAKGGSFYYHFEGTGAAVPLVSGSLADFEAITGYNMSPLEAKTLLTSTAIPKAGDSSGAGIVNTYKIALVAEKMKSTCGRGHESCYHGIFPQITSMTFEADSRAVKSMRSIFPWCFNGSDRGDARPQGSCSEQQNALNTIRRAALREPNRGDLWYELGCAYESEGMAQNASFYYSIAVADGTMAAYPKAVEALTDQGLYGEAANFVYSTPYQGKSLLEKIQSLDLDHSVRKDVYEALADKGTAGSGSRSQVVLLGLKDSDPSVRIAAIQAVKLDDESLTALRDLYGADRLPATRSTIVRKVCHSRSEEAQAILREAAAEPNQDSQFVTKNCLGE
jgi:hypothetical protein